MTAIRPEVRNYLFLILAVVFVSVISKVNGHGRLLWPPARGTIFRHEQFSILNPVPNYDDNGLNCGGAQVQWEENGGKCGECGDNFATKRPRPNEGGGKFDSRIIVENYTASQEIDVHVELTANHLGYFEFRLCDHNNPGIPEEQSCLDKHLLQIVDENNPMRTREQVLGHVNDYKLKLKLPAGLTCFQCVLQWHYFAGNSWGECADGSGALGCGNQETFRGCSDIGIY